MKKRPAPQRHRPLFYSLFFLYPHHIRGDLGQRMRTAHLHGVGQLTGQLQISSRYDVQQFLARVQAHDAAPLSMLTGGIHLHTLRCPDEAACERACAALKAAGLLLDD